MPVPVWVVVMFGHGFERNGITPIPNRIEGFDALSAGGLPRGGVTVVIGGAGAGETLFGMQVLATTDREGS